MNRRSFIGMMAGGLVSTPLAEAQQTESIPRIGVLFIGSRNDQLSAFVKAHEEGLRNLGWVRNRNILIEERFSGTEERLPGAVADLLTLNVKAIVTGPNTFIDVAKRATRAVPIVMVYPTDPVGRGYVASLARPGGNITGLSWDASPEIAGKYVELLNQLRPRPSRIAGIVDPTVADQPYRLEADIAAKRHGMTLQYVEVHAPTDVPGAFETIVSQQVGAVIIFSGPFLWGSRREISDLARKHGLPTLFFYRDGPDAGGLMSYGPNLRESWRRAAWYVDKILKGAKPADLPVEQPTKFELVINLKTAKALGLTIPPSLLQRADQVIE